MTDMNKLDRLKPDDVDIVIYHDPCADGSGAALTVYDYFRGNANKTIKYYPTGFNTPLPDDEDIIGKNVLICDFSYKKDILLSMIKKSKNLLVIDHHKTAQQELADIEDKYKIFDMNHSGAYLTWMYFNPNKKVPLLVDYIQDFDIWTKKLEHISKYSAWISGNDITYLFLDKYLDDKLFLDTLLTEGAGMEAKDKYYIESSTKHSACKFHKIGDKYLFIAYLNTSILKSELGNSILNKFPYCDFSAVYNISDYSNSTFFSLRSCDNKYDCSEIALKLGGGGHRNASGLKLEYVCSCLPGLIDSNKLYEKLDNVYIKDSIVYCQAEDFKYYLGDYLLQTKYIKDKVNVQEGASIVNIKDSNSSLFLNLNIAAIYSYNAVNDKSSYQLVFKKGLDVIELNKLKKLYDVDTDNKIVYSGIVKELIVSKESDSNNMVLDNDIIDEKK